MYINAFLYNPSFYGCSVSDEPTSPSIDLKAKHIPASSVVSSAMNSAPVLSASPSSPTFTFAMNRHYSQDCSKYIANIAFLNLSYSNLDCKLACEHPENYKTTRWQHCCYLLHIHISSAQSDSTTFSSEYQPTLANISEKKGKNGKTLEIM